MGALIYNVAVKKKKTVQPVSTLRLLHHSPLICMDGGSQTDQDGDELTKQWELLKGGQGDRQQPLTSSGLPLSEYRLKTVALQWFTIASEVDQVTGDR